MKLTRFITPKLLMFFTVFVLLFSVLLWRLIDIQLYRGGDFVKLADANRLFKVRLPAERGVFLDRYGDPLVRNTPRYYEIDSPLALFSEHTPLDQPAALQKMATQSGTIGYDLEREYLYPMATSHVLGYTGAVSAADLKRDNRLNIEDTVGKLGMERLFDEVVRGIAGVEHYEVNALGQKQRKVGERPGVPGLNIETTIDPYLSEAAFQLMGNQRGAVVIMDAATGEVLSLVSSPTFDPTVLSTKYLDEQLERERRQQISDFFTHPQKLFFNRAVSGTYPPGSIFKLITALAGLEKDAIDAGTLVDDQGVLEIGEYTYANWYYTQYGRNEGNISLVRALARSNDIYFYKAAEWTGPTALAEMARLFGLGSKTGIEMNGEAAGLVPDPAWKERELGEKWFTGNTFHFGIGQDNLLVTPLQIAQLVQTVAKRGTLCRPSLVRHNPLLMDQRAETSCSELGIDEADMQLVMEGMLDACSSGGTAYPFFAHNEQYRQRELPALDEIHRGAVACKTGTSEFGVTDAKGYKKTHGWFAAIVGVNLQDFQQQTDTNEEASESGELATSESLDLHEMWRQRALKTGFPTELVMVALVESDEAQPYKEGSSDAAPVIKGIVDWLRGTPLAEVEGKADVVPDGVLAE